jgi:hypothetical protein
MPQNENEQKKKTPLRHRLADIVMGAASGYATGMESDIPEAGIAKGLVSGFQTGQTLGKDRRKNELIQMVRNAPPEKRAEAARQAFMELNPDKYAQSEFDRETELFKAFSQPGKKTIRVKVSQINPNITPELDREVDVSEEKYLDLMKPAQEKDVSFEREKQLRGEFTKASDQFADTAQSFKRVVDSAKNPSPAGDIALIFNYMKMLDPNSTVREGEFATAQQAGSIPSQIISAYNRAVSGERLADGMRQDFVQRASQLYMGQETQQDQREDEYRRLAQIYKANPEAVIVNLRASGAVFNSVEEAEAAGLPKGTPVLVGGRLAVTE